MDIDQISGQCQHPGCKCEHPSTSDFCSDYCESSPEGEIDNVCLCGHPECSE